MPSVTTRSCKVPSGSSRLPVERWCNRLTEGTRKKLGGRAPLNPPHRQVGHPRSPGREPHPPRPPPPGGAPPPLGKPPRGGGGESRAGPAPPPRGSGCGPPPFVQPFAPGFSPPP